MLDEVFYESLVRHPLPVRESAIRAMSGRSMAIDLHIWLAYRLHHLTCPTRVPWPAIYRQFGIGFALPRQFKAHARQALALALAAYPEAQVIPGLADQNPCAHLRSPSDMMVQGWAASLFQASQQWSTRLS